MAEQPTDAEVLRAHLDGKLCPRCPSRGRDGCPVWQAAYRQAALAVARHGGWH